MKTVVRMFFCFLLIGKGVFEKKMGGMGNKMVWLVWKGNEGCIRDYAG